MRPELVRVRPARREDAPDLARLVDLAGEGLPSHLWARSAAPGETPLSIGIRRAERDEGSFSWRNAVAAEVDGVVAGAMVTYRIGDAPAPLDGLPPMFRPLQALENRAPGSQYVNVLATYPAFRRRGVGRALLAEAAARAEGNALSLIVADGNAPAIALYRATGFVETALAAMVKEDWASASTNWVLMLKPAVR